MIKRTGIDILRSPIAILVFLLIAIGLGYLIASGGLRTAIMLVAIPPVLLYLNRFFVNPRIGIYTVIILAFTAIGLNRYIPGIPLGLSIDGVLVLTYICYFF